MPQENTTKDRSTFDAGAPTLAFADPGVLENIGSYTDLVESAQRSGLIEPAKAARLLEEARGAPYRAQEVLAEARILARVISRIFTSLAAGTEPAAGDLEFLNGTLSRAMVHLAVAPAATREGQGFGWTWRSDGRDGRDGGDYLDAMLWPVVRDAAELLVGQDPARIRLCAGPACERLFLDKSKAGRRRWCRMDTCGNRAKARRYTRRQTKKS